MILVVGLGNPGKKFKNTRHNVGFSVLDLLTKSKDWKENKSGCYLYSKKQIANKTIKLIQPLTFMNNSGQAVKHAAGKYSFESKNLIVIYDDIDLSLGAIRISRNISSGGHKGVQSIINELRTKDFIRIRIGIKPDSFFSVSESLEDFVLKKFSKKEKKTIEKARDKACESLKEIIKNGLENAMNKFN